MNSLSSHVLDTTLGQPAVGMPITLTSPSGESFTATTDNDGRCKSWGTLHLEQGQYCMRFHCQDYLVSTHGNSFYPHVDITFEIVTDSEHYHVPLLVTPYGYSTYRGS